MDVCYAAEHEPETAGTSIFTTEATAPGGSKEINDCGICARHWLWHSLVCQLATSVQVKHLKKTQINVRMIIN